jgi:hypothetical protein
MKHIARPVACVVIAAQLLLAVPAMAHAPDPGTNTQAHCDAMVVPATAATHDDGCPCCPDGAGSMKDCLVMCSLAVAVTPSLFVSTVTPSQAEPFVELSDYITALADPPLKPPPIA